MKTGVIQCLTSINKSGLKKKKKKDLKSELQVQLEPLAE